MLIDEYDAPLNSAIGKGYYSLIVETIREMFRHGMKNNNHVEKAVMTGILRVAKADLFSGLNNFSEYGVLDKKYAENFGFTEAEVNQLLEDNLEERLAQEEKELQKTQVKTWYNGYNIGDYTIYNPWSIMHCLDRGKSDPKNALRAYWIETGSTQLIEEAFKNLPNIDVSNKLIKGDYLEQHIDSYVNLEYIKTNGDAFFSLLLHTGYLTRVEKDVYKIPNMEVKKYFYEKLLPIWIEKVFGNSIDTKGLINELVHNIEDEERYKEVIQTKLLNNMDQSEKTEADFQALLNGLAYLASITKQNIKHIPHSEVYTKHGKRLDCFFIPLDKKSNTVIIHEYKKQDKTNKIGELLEDALWQIYVNQYIDKTLELYDNHNHNHYWQAIIVRAIAFFKDDMQCKWSVKIEGFRYTIEQARILNNLFSENGKLITNYNELLGGKKGVTKQMTKAAREKFLKDHVARTIHELLKTYSDKSLGEKSSSLLIKPGDQTFIDQDSISEI